MPDIFDELAGVQPRIAALPPTNGPDVFDMLAGPQQPKQPTERGLIPEIVNQGIAGVVVDTPRMIGKGMQYIASPGSSVYEAGKSMADSADERAKDPYWMPSATSETTAGQFFAKGARQIGPSVLPAAAFTAGVALAPEAVIPATIAGLAGSALGAVPAGLSQAQETYEKGLKKYGLTEEQAAQLPDDPRVLEAKSASRLTGGIEWGGETVGGALAGRMVGAGGKALGFVGDKIMGRTAGTAAESFIQGIAKPQAIKNYFSSAVETALEETATEMAQGAGEAEVERQYGFDNESPWKAAKDAIAPTIGMTFLMSLAGIPGRVKHSVQQRNLVNALGNPEVDQNVRVEAAKAVADGLSKVDEEAARNFQAHAIDAIGGEAETGTAPYALDLKNPAILQPFTGPAAETQDAATESDSAGTAQVTKKEKPSPAGTSMLNDSNPQPVAVPEQKQEQPAAEQTESIAVPPSFSSTPMVDISSAAAPAPSLSQVGTDTELNNAIAYNQSLLSEGKPGLMQNRGISDDQFAASLLAQFQRSKGGLYGATDLLSEVQDQRAGEVDRPQVAVPDLQRDLGGGGSYNPQSEGVTQVDPRIAALEQQKAAILADPANRGIAGSEVFTPQATQRVNEINGQIQALQQQAKQSVQDIPAAAAVNQQPSTINQQQSPDPFHIENFLEGIGIKPISNTRTEGRTFFKETKGWQAADGRLVFSKLDKGEADRLEQAAMAAGHTVERRPVQQASHKIINGQSVPSYVDVPGKFAVSITPGVAPAASVSTDLAPSVNPPPSTNNRKPSTSKHRSLLADIRRAGGMRLNSMVKAGDAKKILGKNGSGNRYVTITNKQGYGVDDMARIMADDGWQVPRLTNGDVDSQAFMNMVENAYTGKAPVHPDNAEHRAEAAYDAEVARLAEQYAELAPEEIQQNLDAIDAEVEKLAEGEITQEVVNDALAFFDQFIASDSGEAAATEAPAVHDGNAQAVPTENAGENGTAGSNGVAAENVKPEQTAAYGANNKLVTADRAAEIRKRLKAKFDNQLSSGIDPEMLALGTELAIFHIEAGVRKFADFTAAMARDLGVPLHRLREYLRGWYNGARDTMEDKGLSVDDMDNSAEVREAHKALFEQQVTAKEAPTTRPRQPERKSKHMQRLETMQAMARTEQGKAAWQKRIEALQRKEQPTVKETPAIPENWRELDKKPEPTFTRGARIQTADGEHGAISNVHSYTVTSALIDITRNGVQPTNRKIEHSHSYTARMDNGVEQTVYNFQPETDPAPAVVPAPVYKGKAIDPQRLLDDIKSSKDNAANRRAAASRAKKASSIKEHNDSARRFTEIAAEQQAAFDAWAAEHPAEAIKYQQPATMMVAPASDESTGQEKTPGNAVKMSLKETTHSKKGHKLFVVTMDERVERDVYDRLNRDAKRTGKGYSAYRGHGAIPGFQFLDRESAASFMQKWAGAAPKQSPPGKTKVSYADFMTNVFHTLEENGYLHENARNSDRNAFALTYAQAYKKAVTDEMLASLKKGEDIAEAHDSAIKNDTKDLADKFFDRARGKVAQAEPTSQQQSTVTELGPVGTKVESIHNPGVEYTISDIQADGKIAVDNGKFKNLDPDMFQVVEQKTLPSSADSGIMVNEKDQTNGGNGDEIRGNVQGAAEVAEPAGAATPEKRGKTGRSAAAGTGDVQPAGSGHSSGNDQGSAGRSAVHGTGAAAEQGGKRGQGNGGGGHGGVLEFNPVDFRITDEHGIGKGGAKQKAQDNITAIKLLKQITSEERQASPEEQAQLVKYVGWGASELANGIFENTGYNPASYRHEASWFKDGWQELGKELKDLLSAEEYAAAKRSTVSAFYTPIPIYRAMYAAAEQLGFGGGRILTPGSGLMHEAGTLPDSFLKNTRITGVELDPISAAISKLLYPSHDIRQQGFEKFVMPDNFYDMAIGNPPFVDLDVTSDPAYAKYRFKLHDYFFAKAIDKVRPGGLLMFVTSKGTMDKANDKARTYLADRADLLGAIRLPESTFKENAGTETVTDVIFLRKRLAGEQPSGHSWSALKEVKTPDGPAYINEYFANNPDMVLGRNAIVSSQHGPKYTVLAEKGADLADLFRAAASRNLPENVYSVDKAESPADRDTVQHDLAPSSIKEGAFYLDDKGNVLSKESGVGIPTTKRGKDLEIIKAFIPLRDAVRQVLYVQMKDGDLPAAQKELKRQYDSFVKKFGLINKEQRIVTTRNGVESESIRYPNFSPFRDDPDAYLVASIEIYNRDTGKATTAPIFTERTIKPEVIPQINSITDALHVVMHESGRVDMAQIAAHMNVTEQQAVDALGSTIYHNPQTAQWETDDEYLSGNVKQKLALAESTAMADKRYNRNVEALRAVQPEDLPPSRISIGLGEPIVKPEHVEQFAKEVIGMGIKVSHLKNNGSWAVEKQSGYQTAAATSDYGTNRRAAWQLIDDALNSRQIRIESYEMRDGKEVKVFDKDATNAANEKLARIKEKFSQWIWEDGKRSEELARAFNDAYNTNVKRVYGGDHIDKMTFPGMSAAVNPFDHQKRVAWRVVQNGNTYMAHSVGAGKTIGSILAGMELKRLGIKKKPTWVVPNHMLKQFASEFLQLYPSAKIIVADEAQFSKENRNRFMGRVAAENWDGVIITHSAFGKMQTSPEFSAQFIQEQIDELEWALNDVEKGDRLKRKQIEQAKARLEQRLEKVLSAKDKDKGVTFEETGIDQIFVDEAHEFRKLDFVTNQTNIKGIDPNGSLMSFDLYVKSRYLEKLYPGRSLVLMSGTPITNTIGEIFTIQRFLQEHKLKELGLDNFDAWSSTFGDMVTKLEATPAGGYKPVTRFAKFKKLSTLTQLWSEVGDYVHAGDLTYIKRPTIKTGGRQLISSEQSPAQQAWKKSAAIRIKAIEERKRPPQKGDDILLSVITDGRHVALDERYVPGVTRPSKDNKLEKMVNKVADIWRDTAKEKLTQMIFSDLGMPGSEERRGFSVYNQIKASLIEQGVPAHEIAFMQDFKKSDAKLKLFDAMNSGKIRVLIGSSEAMGTGVNAQKKLVALHHLDPDTYLPSNIEQREGRIVRQGNQNKEVQIYAYATRGSYDESMWQFLETKQRFIDQFLSGDSTVDEATDVDGGADSFAMARAMSSDNPLVLERAGVESDIQRLESLRRAYFDDQQRLRLMAARAEENLPLYQKEITALEKLIAKRVDTAGESFAMKVGNSSYDSRKDAGAALDKVINREITGAYDDDWHKVGELAGLDIMARSGISMKIPWLTLAVGSGRTLSSYVSFSGLESVNDLDTVGLSMKLENLARSFDKHLATIRENVAKDEKTLADNSERIGRPFEHAQALEDKRRRLAEIETTLQTQEQAGVTSDENIEDMARSIAGSKGVFALAPENKNAIIDRTSKIKDGYYVPERLPETYGRSEHEGTLGAATAYARGIHETVRRGEISGDSAWEKHQRYKELAANDIRPQEAAALRTWAEANNLIFDTAEFDRQWKKDGSKGGAEHQVYLSTDGTRVFKRNKLNLAFHETYLDYFQRLAVHNTEFPSTAYTLEGFVESDGVLMPVVSQPAVKGRKATFAESHGDMIKSGYEPIGTSNTPTSYRIPGTGLVVRDVHGDNTRIGANGRIYVIDPVIEFDLDTKAERLAAEAGIDVLPQPATDETVQFGSEVDDALVAWGKESHFKLNGESAGIDAIKVQAWVSALPISSHVVVEQSVAEWPAAARAQVDAAGVDYGRVQAMELAGKIYVATGNIPTMEKARALVIGHELAHAGQTEKITDMAVYWFNRTKGSNNENTRAIHQVLIEAAANYGFDLKNKDDFRLAVKEATAALAEQAIEKGWKQNGLLRQLFRYLKNWLQQTGLITHVSDQDLLFAVAEMLRLGEKRLSEEQGGLSGMMALENQKPTFGSTGTRPNDFITVNGNKDLWAIPAEVAKRTGGRFPDAPVRLMVGKHLGLHRGFGVEHIVAEHSAELAKIGMSAEEYVYSILSRASSVRDTGDQKVLYVFAEGSPRGGAALELRLHGGGFYSIRTAFDMKAVGKVVWSGRTASPGVVEKPFTGVSRQSLPKDKPTFSLSAKEPSRTAHGQETEVSPKPTLEGLDAQTYNNSTPSNKDVNGNFSLSSATNAVTQAASRVNQHITDSTMAEMMSGIGRTLNPFDWSRTRTWFESAAPDSVKHALGWMFANPVYQAERDPHKRAFVDAGIQREQDKIGFQLAFMNWDGNTKPTTLWGRFKDTYGQWHNSDKATAWGRIQAANAALSAKDQLAVNVMLVEGDRRSKVYTSLDKAMVNPEIAKAKPGQAAYDVYRSVRSHIDNHVAKERERIFTEMSRKAGVDEKTIKKHIEDYRQSLSERPGWLPRNHGEGKHQVNVYHIVKDLKFDVKNVNTEGHGLDSRQAYLPYYAGPDATQMMRDIANRINEKYSDVDKDKRLKFGAFINGKLLTANGQTIITGSSADIGDFLRQAQTIIPAVEQKNQQRLIDLRKERQQAEKDGATSGQIKELDEQIADATDTRVRVKVFMRLHESKAAAEKKLAEVKGNIKAAMPVNYREPEQYESDYKVVDGMTESAYGDLAGDFAMERAQLEAIKRAAQSGEISKEESAKLRNEIIRSSAEVLMGRGAGRHQIQRAPYMIEGYDSDNAVQLYHDYMTATAGMLSKALYAREQFENFRYADPSVKTWAEQYIKDTLRNMGLADRISGNARSVATFMALGFKVSSVLVNATQVWTLGVAELGRRTKQNSIAMIAGAQKSIFTDNLSKDERELFNSAIWKLQEMETVVHEASGAGEGTAGKLANNWQTLVGKAMMPFQEMELLNRKTMILAAYRAALADKMSKQDAIEFALDVNRKTNFEMSRANLPGWARNPVGRTAYALQTFVWNNWNWVYNRATSGQKADMLALLKYGAMLAMIGGAMALPGSDEADKIYRRIFGRSIKLDMQQWSRQHLKDFGWFGDRLDGFLWHGGVGAVGINISNAMRLNIPMSGVLTGDSSAGEAAMGIWSGLWDKAAKGVEFAAKGQYGRALESAAPAVLESPLKAYRMATEGATTSHGKPVFDENGKPVKYDATDAGLRALGLQPLGQSTRAETAQALNKINAHWNDRRKELLDNLRVGTARMADVVQFNREVRNSQAYPKVDIISANTVRASKVYRPDKKSMAQQRKHLD